MMMCNCNLHQGLGHIFHEIVFLYLCILCTFTLAIDTDYAPPELTSEPEDKYVFEDQVVTLKCKATGNPTPDYRWYKNGRELSVTGPKYNKDGGNLIIDKFDTADDYGKYHCLVRVKADSIKELKLLSRTADVTSAGKSIFCYHVIMFVICNHYHVINRQFSNFDGP